MVLIVAGILFLVLNIPSDVYYVLDGANAIRNQTYEDYAIGILWGNCVMFIYYINHSINFLLYFATGHKFRRAAVETFTCRWCRKRQCDHEEL